MRTSLRLAWITLLAGTVAPLLAQSSSATPYVYVRSNFDQPWGQATNEAAMDSIFGAGNWTTLYYETVPGNSLFATSTQFIFMEGGDSSFDSFQTFIQANLSQLTTWVQQGGRLLIMAAPNNPLTSESVTLPDSIILSSDAFYESAASSAYAMDISNPIFSSPTPTAYYFTGNFFSHGYFSGNSLNALMESNLNEVVLGQDVLGSGLMLFGALTTDNFDSPQPAAHSLLQNIIYYTAFTSI